MGGQNSQDSILERRSRLWNDGDTVTPDAPPGFDTGTEWFGKFFPRGARGLISELSIYARAAAAGSITLHIAPHLGTGPLFMYTFAPGAAWDWVTVLPRIWWNYDSLFIWIHSCDIDVDWAWDQVQPYDMHHSPDLGYHWIPYDYRPYIRVVYAGETPGDVPVSGIVNTVAIPNASPLSSGLTTLNVPGGGNLATITETLGVFKLGLWYVDGAASLADLCPRIVIDGARHDLGDVDMATQYAQYTGLSREGWQWGQYDAANHYYALWLKLPIPFRNSFSIGFHNNAVGVLTGYVWASVEHLA